MKKIIIGLFLSLLLSAKVFASTWQIQDGVNLIKNNNFDKAQKFFEGYVSNNPNDSDGHYYLAVCYKLNNKMADSNFHFQKSYELSRNIAPVTFEPVVGDGMVSDYLDMANMYLESKDYVRAIQYADMAEKADADDAEALVIKTKAYLNQDNKELAGVYFKKALFIDTTLIDSDIAKTLKISTLPVYDFDYYNTKGLEYYYRGDTKNAVEYFNKALKLEPKKAMVHNNLALTYMKQGDLNLAKAVLNHAKRLEKNYSQTYVNLANLESMFVGANKNSAKNKDNIKTYYQKAIKVNPNNKYAYLELGNFYLIEKDYKNATLNFHNAMMLDSKFYEAYIGLGVSHIEEGKYNDALKALRQAGSINPNKGENADMYYYLAKICILNSNYDEARDYLVKAIQKSENSNYYIELGKIYYMKEDYPSSLTAFNKALELDMKFDNEGEIYNYIGLSNYKNFDTDKALYAFKKAVELEPSRAMYVYNLAQVYKSTEDKELYTKTINSISRVRPKTANDYIDLSTIYFDRKNIQDALRYLEEGIAKYPNDRTLYEAKLKYYKVTKNDAAYDDLQRKMKTIFN